LNAVTDHENPTITLTPTGVAPGPRRRAAPGESAAAVALFEQGLASPPGLENRLIVASAELLAVCGTLRRVGPGADIAAARAALARAIIELKYRVVRLDYPPSVAENLCLLFAIVIDEFALQSDWGRESGWENRTLVADLFGYRDGGERFYQVAERALLQPSALGEFLELIYIFLKLGYRGRYARGGDQQRDRLIDRIESVLRSSAAPSQGAEMGIPAVPEANVAGMAGRALRETRSPTQGLSTWRKLLLAAGVLVLASAAVWGGREQMIAREGTRFVEMAREAAAAGQVEYVYRSETGETVKEAGQ